MFSSKKKTHTPIITKGRLTIDEAMIIAEKKYPEKYRWTEMGSLSGMFDHNKIARVAYAKKLMESNNI